MRSKRSVVCWEKFRSSGSAWVISCWVWRVVQKSREVEIRASRSEPACAQQEQRSVEITSQNHGFAISAQSLPHNLEVTHVNLNDQTIEGFRHREFPAFCVQYHPEASAGPHDSSYLFQAFRQLMTKA